MKASFLVKFRQPERSSWVKLTGEKFFGLESLIRGHWVQGWFSLPLSYDLFFLCRSVLNVLMPERTLGGQRHQEYVTADYRTSSPCNVCNKSAKGNLLRFPNVATVLTNCAFFLAILLFAFILFWR